LTRGIGIIAIIAPYPHGIIICIGEKVDSGNCELDDLSSSPTWRTVCVNDHSRERDPLLSGAGAIHPPAQGATLRIHGSLTSLFLALTAMIVMHIPAQELRNFHHTAWSSDSEPGAVFDIQQSPDGYLWLTTSRGVFRFDGVRFQSADEITSGATQHYEFASVFVSSSGAVWFRTRLPGLVLWRDGKLSAFPIKGCTPGLLTDSTVEDRDGTLWVAGSAGLFIIGEGKCERVSDHYGLPGGFPSAIAVDSAGSLWVKMLTGALLYLPRGGAKFKVSPNGEGSVGDLSYLHEGPNGSVWLSDELGLRRISGSIISSRPASRSGPRLPRHPRFGNFAFDGDGTLWAASSNGIQRIPNASELPIGVSVDPADGQTFTLAQGLSSDVAWKILAGREGTVWVGTNSGLDQLRRNVISQLPIPATSEHQLAVAVGERGCVWIGSRSLPLTEVCPDGQTKTFAETRQAISIRRDFKGGVWSSGLGDNHLWRASSGGLDPVHFPHDDLEVPASVTVDKNNDIWILSFGPNVSRGRGQHWENLNQVLGREPGILGAMAGDQAGNVWFAFSNHVIEWDGAGYRRYTYTGKNRFPTSLMIKGSHAWLGAEDGVQLMTEGQFHMLRWKDPGLPGRVSGIVETETGDLWVSGFSGIAHVSADELRKWLQDPDYAVSAESFNTLDGLPGLAAERFPEPSMVEGPDGRLWFATIKGISWLDPASLAKTYNLASPTVLVTSFILDGQTRANLSDLVLPPKTGSLEIDYTALSLAIPERVLFRYKLDGVDKDWQDAGTRRQAYYTKLRPGTYNFSVIACNDHGVWNTTGAVLSFRVTPAWYQTIWFYCLMGLLLLALMWTVVIVRSRQAAARAEMRMGDRLMERDRIARELHDTLLQGVHVLILRFQLVADSIPAGEPLRDETEKTLSYADQILAEGRQRVRDLRTHDGSAGDLAYSFAKLREELHHEFARDFRLVIEGKPQGLHRVVQDEVEMIAREALSNAFQHAQASDILCAIKFTESHFILMCADDGIGIDPQFASNSGRPGHWGLIGMRERAQKIGATLRTQRSTKGGTEVELKVAARLAYLATGKGLSRFLFRRNQG
jgi:signal transduction histidine kinase/ligand-binding sensor domain-containing protein